ncbi:MAG TPA: endonuclease/exonuclease/phosphatase family protein [Acidimicrobiales bacterium]
MPATPPLVASHPHRPPPGRVLRVATFNIRHGAGLDERVDLERVARAIAATGADVVGLQEVDRNLGRTDATDQAAWLAERLGAHLAFAAAVDAPPPAPGRPRRQYGNAVLSWYPIRSAATVVLPRLHRPERRVLLDVRIDVGATPVRVLASHLQNRAPDERLAQAHAVRAHLAAGSGPAVVLADLNARPGAPELAVLTGGLVDAWAAAGSGPGHTYDARTPHARIDYVLVSPDVGVRAAATVRTDASDHLPLVAELVLPSRSPG